MKPEEAADLIDAIAEAIRSQPNQFTFEIKVTGQSNSASAPGATGLSLSVSGLGNTGQVVGFNAGAAVQIANKNIDDIVQRWAGSTISALAELSAALRERQPDKSKIAMLMAKVSNVIGVSAPQAAVNLGVARAVEGL